MGSLISKFWKTSGLIWASIFLLGVGNATAQDDIYLPPKQENKSTTTTPSTGPLIANKGSLNRKYAVDLGFSAGPTGYFIRTQPALNVRLRQETGFSARASVWANINNMFNVQVEGGYLSKIGSFDSERKGLSGATDTLDNTKLSAHYFSLPIFLKLNYPDDNNAKFKFYALFGLEFNFLLAGSNTFTSTAFPKGISIVQDAKDLLQPHETAFVLGFGGNWYFTDGIGIFADVRYGVSGQNVNNGAIRLSSGNNLRVSYIGYQANAGLMLKLY